MNFIGKNIRLNRIVNSKNGKMIIVPMDHGITLGPIVGLKNMKFIINKIVNSNVNSLIIHKGMLKQCYLELIKKIPIILHLSASTKLSSYANFKTIVCSIEEAIKYGVDGVSIHVNLGNRNEHKMLNDFGKIARDADNWGLPLIAMIYSRGKNIKNEFGVDEVSLCARVGVEMGADIVKVSYTGSSESFNKVVDGCRIPIIIAGGNKVESDISILSMVKGAIDAGASGVSLGRNVFQHDNPDKILKSISFIVNDGGSVNDALKFLK